MSLMRIKDYIYMVIDDDKVPYESSYALHISYNIWCSLTPNGLTTRPVDRVKSIFNSLLFKLIWIINKG